MTNLVDRNAHRSPALLANIARSAPRVPWDRFTESIFVPRPGEHVAIVGPTGQGKTALQNAILPKFPFVVVFATKPQDHTMSKLIESRRYVRLAQWVRLSPTEVPRRVLWPDARSIRAVERQRKVFAYALDAIFRERGRPKNAPVGWTVAIDELWYVVNVLKLGPEIKMFLLQGRSLGHNLVLATQRPASVPVEVYDQSTHLFFFRDNDRRNQDRLSEINARNAAMVRAVVANLESHQVLYVNTRTGEMYRTRVPGYLVTDKGRG